MTDAQHRRHFISRVKKAEKSLIRDLQKLVKVRDPWARCKRLWLIARNSELTNLEDFRPGGGFKERPSWLKK